MSESSNNGITIGMVVAGLFSYLKWGSISLALVHALLSWIYVIYYLAKYGVPSWFN